MPCCNEQFLIGYAVGCIPRAANAPHLHDLAGALYGAAQIVACENERARKLLFRPARDIIFPRDVTQDNRTMWRTIRRFALVCADKYDTMGFDARDLREIVNQIEREMNTDNKPAA